MTKARVFYDGNCVFCCKSIGFLKKLDWLGKLDYVNVRDETQAILKEPLLAGAPLLEQMHVLPIRGRTLLGGYSALRWIAWRMPATWLIAPFLYLPGVPFLGDKAYRWVARNRFKIVPCEHGACQVLHRTK